MNWIKNIWLHLNNLLNYPMSSFSKIIDFLKKENRSQTISFLCMKTDLDFMETKNILDFLNEKGYLVNSNDYERILLTDQARKKHVL